MTLRELRAALAALPADTSPDTEIRLWVDYGGSFEVAGLVLDQRLQILLIDSER